MSRGLPGPYSSQLSSTNQNVCCMSIHPFYLLVIGRHSQGSESFQQDLQQRELYRGCSIVSPEGGGILSQRMALFKYPKQLVQFTFLCGDSYSNDQELFLLFFYLNVMSYLMMAQLLVWLPVQKQQVGAPHSGGADLLEVCCSIALGIASLTFLC